MIIAQIHYFIKGISQYLNNFLNYKRNICSDMQHAKPSLSITEVTAFVFRLPLPFSSVTHVDQL